MESSQDSAALATVTEAWTEQGRWSRAADRLKRRLARARIIALGMASIAAVFATAAAQAPGVPGRILAGVAGVCAALSTGPLIRHRVGRPAVEPQVRCRSVAEAIKAEVYTFLAGVDSYRASDRVDRFRAALAGLLEEADELSDKLIGVEAVDRPLPAVSDVDSYIAERIHTQIDQYYRPMQARMATRGRRYRIVEVILGVSAAVLSTVAAAGGGEEFAAWLPVITTLSAAFVAEAAFQRHDTLALEYARTIRQLERLLTRRDDLRVAGVAADDELVLACERVIATQNDAWMSQTLSAGEAVKE